MALKIIVVGSVTGCVRDVFQKLQKLHVKQKFSLGIVVGDLLGDASDNEKHADDISALVKGDITVPFPTYFGLGNHELPSRVVEKLKRSSDELCPNLVFLGRRVTIKTSDGIRIVALGGKFDSTSTGKDLDNYTPRFTESDAKALSGAKSAHILLTSAWPSSVRKESNIPLPEGFVPSSEVPCLANLCSKLRPRYHFSSEGGFFYEREPFYHLPVEESGVKAVTRFLNIAPYQNPAKQKGIYAFTFDVNAPLSTTVPGGTTITPFSQPAQKRQPATTTLDEAYNQFRFSDQSSRPPNNKRSKRAPPPPPGPGECFFCLSNPNFENHLATSIGSESLVTTAKGPLPTAATFPSLGFPGHMLIIPISHSPTFESFGDDAARLSTLAEMNRYRHALNRMFHNKSNGELGSVTWEVSRWKGVHIHWQHLPIPAKMIQNGMAEQAFRTEAERQGFPSFTKESNIKDLDMERGETFRVVLWPSSGEENAFNGDDLSTTLTLPLSPDFRFDLQFGRKVMAKLLQLEQRINWREDIQSIGEETKDAEAFKEAFKNFDFSLTEEE